MVAILRCSLELDNKPCYDFDCSMQTHCWACHTLVVSRISPNQAVWPSWQHNESNRLQQVVYTAAATASSSGYMQQITVYMADASAASTASAAISTAYITC